MDQDNTKRKDSREDKNHGNGTDRNNREDKRTGKNTRKKEDKEECRDTG